MAQQNSGIPTIEIYWSLVDKADKKFAKIRDLPLYERNRPLRYSLVLDPHPDTLPHVSSYNPKRNLKLRDAVLSSYHPNEVKYSELTLDTYRMLQSLEWEPSGAFYHSGSGAGQDGTTKNSGSNHTQDITDPTLPRNPRKAVLYRPSVTHFIAILATACDELPADGVLFIYLSGKSGSIFSPSSGAGSRLGPESSVKILLQSQTALHATSMTDGHSPLCGQSEEALSNSPLDCIHIGCRGNEGSSYIYPSDLLPFTRRPLFIVIDIQMHSSKLVLFLKSHVITGIQQRSMIISGSEKGESAAMLLSPKSSPSTSTGEWSRHLNGSLFTIFLTAPIQAFCLLLGSSGSDIQTDLYDTADKLLSSSLNDWGLTLATSGSLDPVWSQVFCDPFLRRLLLRFIFCRAVLALYAPSHEKGEFIPQCLPSLPEFVHPSSHAIQSTILQIANVFDARSSFIFSEDLIPQENSHISQE
uniref:Protein SCAI n=1 Tax=Chenopodium quinoa TaxID=63459 RepID=A0A803M4F6_CHEQI